MAPPSTDSSATHTRSSLGSHVNSHSSSRNSGHSQSLVHDGDHSQSGSHRASEASSRHSQSAARSGSLRSGSLGQSPAHDSGHANANSGGYPLSPADGGRHSLSQEKSGGLAQQSPVHSGGHAHSAGRQPSQVGSGRHSQSPGGLGMSPAKSASRTSHVASPGRAESELTAGSDVSSKLRPGAAVEVKSKTADAWVPGQVISPEEDGKVTVEFQIGEETLRKSIKTLSQDIRPPQTPCEEKRPSTLSTDGKRPTTWSAAQKEALRTLDEMQAKEEELTNVPPVKERATAAAKWNRARKIVEGSRSVELWCSGLEHLNGSWACSPSESGAPTFKHELSQQKWLFVGLNGSWWLGDEECKEKRQAKGWMRSDAVAPGTLPQDVASWEAPKSGEWEPQTSARFWLSESVDVAWQQMRVTSFQTPVIEIRGVTDSLVDGLYDFVVGEDEAGEPPAFQHQQRPNLWLFLARDQRWWIGNTAAMEAKDDRGLMHSACVHPGAHPSEAVGWHMRVAKVWEECRAVKIRKVPGAKRAGEKWEEASGRAKNVQIWGKEFYHGDYILQETADGLPAYQYSVDEDVWLYLAMDGCWWLADTDNKDARRARGYLKSDEVDPGTLPQDVHCWKHLKANSWEEDPMVRVMVREAVASEWQVAWQHLTRDEVEVIEIQNVSGPKYDGMYDLLEPENGSKGDPPTFQHQINQDLFLFVARDGRWWISTEQSMLQREPKGRMHSDLIKPGMPPFAQGLSWHVFNRTSQEWERQEDIAVLA